MTRTHKHYQDGCNTGKNQILKNTFFDSGFSMAEEQPTILRTGGRQRETLPNCLMQGLFTKVLTYQVLSLHPGPHPCPGSLRNYNKIKSNSKGGGENIRKQKNQKLKSKEKTRVRIKRDSVCVCVCHNLKVLRARKNLKTEYSSCERLSLQNIILKGIIQETDKAIHKIHGFFFPSSLAHRKRKTFHY